MTVCCFLLPPMAGEKVTVNGFAFVSAVMYLIYFSHTLPFHETEVPILGKKKSPFSVKWTKSLIDALLILQSCSSVTQLP